MSFAFFFEVRSKSQQPIIEYYAVRDGYIIKPCYLEMSERRDGSLRELHDCSPVRAAHHSNLEEQNDRAELWMALEKRGRVLKARTTTKDTNIRLRGSKKKTKQTASHKVLVPPRYFSMRPTDGPPLFSNSKLGTQNSRKSQGQK